VVARIALTMACSPYDRMEALAQGLVQPEGIDLRYLAIQSPPEIFARMIKTQSFDVAEMSLAHYSIMRTRGQFPFVAIPVFPSRLFRHGFIFVNRNAGIAEPRGLEGRRVGVQEYRQTAGVWIRGILQHEYGVDLRSITWVEGGVNEARQPDHEMDLRPIGELKLEMIGPERTLSEMLEAGEIDAYFGARRPAAFDKGRNVVRLFPDYRAREKDFYRRTGFHPIMHTLVIRADLYEEHPWVPESLYKACRESKAWALKQMRFSGAQRSMLPWLYDEIAEMDELMGPDPWPYGLKANRKMLEAFQGYLVEQHFMEAAKPIDELFTPIVEWAE
jgi:4,5-dihydroxyphthalate decarboxylase